MKDRLRDKVMLDSNLLSLFELTVAIYKNKREKPVLSEQFGKNGQIDRITFVDIPRKVMSGLFDSIIGQKESIKCWYSLRYSLGETRKDDKFEFEIATKHS